MSSDDDHDSASDGSEDSSGGSGSDAESGSGGDDDSGSDAEKSSKLSPEQLAKSVAAVFGIGEAMRVTLAAVLDKLRSEELKLFAPDRSASRQPPSETSVRFEPKSSRSLAAPRLAEVPSAVDIGIQADGEEKQTEMRHGRHCQHCGRHRSRSRSTDGIHDGRRDGETAGSELTGGMDARKAVRHSRLPSPASHAPVKSDSAPRSKPPLPPLPTPGSSKVAVENAIRALLDED